MNAVLLRALLAALLIAAAAPATVAQAPPGESGSEGPGALQREMRKFFALRLRAELDLTDEQAEQVMPALEAVESDRGALQRRLAETRRALHRGVEFGAGDEELQALLDQLDGIESQQLELKQRTFREIDQHLTVRQRVKLRFFIERFHQRMREKIDDLRGERRGRDQGGSPRRRPPGDDP